MGKELTHRELSIITCQSPMEGFFGSALEYTLHCTFVGNSWGTTNYTPTRPIVNCEFLYDRRETERISIQRKDRNGTITLYSTCRDYTEQKLY
ncbi:hypothetical protein AVEN_93571-1 [Araneus ventricosus]|uniref:Uncharacterized protein n=1 Tax=Araneus ventricosus TaxID=182803 RepID=A0A4Y2AQ00_ARAVE|nr:hypothetical protein AVEN_93571-1 [Araneus ventricosus]